MRTLPLPLVRVPTLTLR